MQIGKAIVAPSMNGFPRRRAILRVSTVLVVALAVIYKLDTLPQGLNAVYLTGVNGISTPVRSAIDQRPSTDSLRNAWSGQPPPAFSVTWTGSFLVPRGGSYLFSVASDDGSRLFVDGRQVVENWGRHETRVATGSIQLDRGVHAMFIEYFQDGGGFDFELSWARDGVALEPMPAWVLTARRASLPRTLASIALVRVLGLAVALWIGSLVVVGAAASWRVFKRWIETFGKDRTHRVLTGVIAGSFVLNVLGVWWGVPSVWAGDEITPFSVYTALSHRFSGGWWDRYPPFHYMVLSVVSAPSLVMNALGWVQWSDRTHDVFLIVLNRLVSVAAAAGTLIAVYRCGALAFSRRAGLCAAGMVALLTPFVYYAKTANPEMPYVFWFAVSLVFYVKFLQTLAVKDAVFFAAAASASICTKDQAYGLYLVAPLVIVFRLWQASRDRGVTHPLARAIVDVRVALAGATVAVFFILVYALPFNLEGFVAHFKDITGPGSEPWRMFEPTLTGRMALLRLNLVLDRQSWGWPLWIAGIVGLVLALKNPQTRRVAVCLALVCVGYYAGFINVVLYTFDRYLLPICIVQALFGGVAIDRFLGSARRPAPARVAIVTAMFA